MPNKLTTDNFLPHHRIKSSYLSRPSSYRARGDYTSPISPGVRLITDVVSALPALTIDSPPPKLIALRKPTRKKQFIWASATVLLILGLAASMISLDGHGPPAEHVHALQTATSKKPTAVETPAIIRWPVRIKIPKIGVDAPLDYVGLTPGGMLDAPKVAGNAGWYDKGPKPGEIGNAVIDGHFGWEHNLPAVFDKLHDLQKGDTLSITDEKGGTINFVIRTMESYAENQSASAIFQTSDGYAHLNLITCDGTWNAAQKSYTNRLVVFTDKE